MQTVELSQYIVKEHFTVDLHEDCPLVKSDLRFSLIFLRHTNDNCLNICKSSADTRQENDEPEDTTIEEDSHDGHVSLLSLFSDV